MANGLTPLARLGAMLLLCVACSSDESSDVAFGGAPTQPEGGEGSASTGNAGGGGTASRAGASGAQPPAAGNAAGGALTSAGSAGKSSAGGGGDPPPAVDGRSIYTLECHGDSKDCSLATVPCFGVSSPTPNVAAGWACANRCRSDADCSNAPSGAEAQASCVPFTASGHCLLVCQNENQSFACPGGMSCYTPEKSPIGYCLWQ